MTIFYFVFRRFSRRFVSNFLLISLLPLIAALMPPGEWNPLPQGFYLYGLIVLFIAARASEFIMEDRTSKVLLRIEASPVTHFQYLAQNLLAYALIMTMPNLLILIVGRAVHGASVISPHLLFLVYSVYSLSAVGFCLAWYSVFRNKESAFALLSGIAVLMSLVGGVMFPIQAMPEVLQRVAMLLPTYWLMDGLLVVSLGAPTVDLLLPLGILLLQATAFIVIGSRRPIA